MIDPTAPDPHTSAGLHRMLLRVAGHAPDEIITVLREWLSEGQLTEVAEALQTVVLTLEMSLPAADVELLATVLPDHSKLGSIDRRADSAPDPVPPYVFAPMPPGAVSWSGPTEPQLLDLTNIHADLAEVVTDGVDGVAIETARAEPGAVALWRAWRLPVPAQPTADVTRVYLLEVDRPAGELPAVTVRLQRALDEVGLPDPQVEVYHPGLDLPGYQRLARGQSALLWAATSGEAVRVARVYDRFAPDTGPQFDPGHERLTDPDEREKVLHYLRSGAPLLVTPTREPDILHPDRPAVVPLSFRTDGRWIWTDAVGYYLQGYGVRPDAELLAWIRQTGCPEAPAVHPVAVHRALAALLGPVQVAAELPEPVQVPAGIPGPIQVTTG